MKKNNLNRILGRWGLTSLGIGAVIGGGIFTLTGIAAHDHAGPALALSFVIAGIGCLFASLCYAEFSSVFGQCDCQWLKNDGLRSGLCRV